MQDVVTLVTGARKGIGRYLAEHYLAKGHIVVGCSRSDSDLSDKNYVHVQADVADEKSSSNVFLKIRKEFDRLDHLINNAGIASMNHSLLTPMSTVRKVLDTNVMGTFLFCREAARLMQKRKFGRIVNFTTIAVPLNLEGEAIYVASKSAVEGLTRVLSRELAIYNITVNAVGPVPTDTDLIRSIPKEKIDNLIARQGIKRLGTMEDISNICDFFLQPESNFVSGQTLYLGGV